MRETLYKFEFKNYYTHFFKDYNELPTTSVRNGKVSDSFLEDNYNQSSFSQKTMVFADGRKKKEPIYFTPGHVETTEEMFEKNYGNPLCAVTRRNLLVLVERDKNKITFKKFSTTSLRKVGKTYFEKSSRIDYISYNTETKFIYQGFIIDYHKKKARKSVRKNFFVKNIFNSFLSELKNQISGFNQKSETEFDMFDCVGVFTRACGFGISLTLSTDDIIYQEYLKKMGIKYPNNFPAFRTCSYETQPKLREIRKEKMKLVDAYMKKNRLSGKVLKKALHLVENINLNQYRFALKNFGSDIINNDLKLVKDLLEYSEDIYNYTSTPPFNKIFTPVELKKVLSVYKDIIENKNLNLFTFTDHINFYSKLKKFGESVKWKTEKADDSFHTEHLDWSDKVSQYEVGHYERIYPEAIEKICCADIISDGVKYIPVLLKNSQEYNEESLTQSNCVKTYISYPNSIIFSLRKEGVDSKDRATCEYNLLKLYDENGEGTGEILTKNVQSRIRFNGSLSKEWQDVIEKLDELVNRYANSYEYKNVELRKTCKNGVVLHTGSQWDGSTLKWNQEEINVYNF